MSLALGIAFSSGCATAPPPRDKVPAQASQATEAQVRGAWADAASQAIATASSAVAVMGNYDTIKGVAILQLLEDVPSGRLAELAGQESALGGWSALALSVRNTLITNADLREAAHRLIVDLPAIDVGVSDYMELCWQYGKLFKPPSRVAVLLPSEGGLSSAGKAIRDGLLSGYLDGTASSKVGFFPISQEPASALAAYDQAVSEGYQWIIGPLRRESVQAVSDFAGREVPTLLLNSLNRKLATGRGDKRRFYSLSLSQEHEARAVARHAMDGGYSRVIILVSDTPWGEGMEQAFSDEWVNGQGEIIGTATFSLSQVDHAETLTRILRIEDSRKRKSQLQAAMGLPLGFEATRRDDFDLIFMAVDPRLGRQLKPQLRFYDAGEKPVLAMSRVFSGRIDKAADRDLNGIEFPATRWTLSARRDKETDQLASLRDGSLATLHALGIDAWNLLPWIPLMSKDPDLVYPGAVGDLVLDGNGDLAREPVWARFSSGRPVAASEQK